MHHMVSHEGASNRPESAKPICRVRKTLSTPFVQFLKTLGVKCRPAVGAAAEPSAWE